MSASLTSGPVALCVPRESHVLSRLAGLPDLRDSRGVRPTWGGGLAVGVAAVMAGTRSFIAIGEWAAEATGEVLMSLGMIRGAADEATFRRLFVKVDADAVDRLLGALWTRTWAVDSRRVIAIDGRTGSSPRSPRPTS